MKLGISEILEKASRMNKRQDKIDYLRQNFNPVLGMILKYTYDPAVIWELPPGAPPYKPSQYPDSHGMLYTEARKLYLFIKGGNENLKPFKRETLFINLLESVHAEDAKVLLGAKDKELPYRGINKKVVQEAFPGLINE